MRIALAVVCLAALGWSARADALRCDGRVVDLGDHAVQLRERCGEPYWIDTYREYLIVGEFGPLERREERLVEAWYYNFGPNRLLRRVLLIDRRVHGEESLGYGFAELGTQCRLDGLPIGTPAGVVVARCGEPLSREQRYADHTERDDRGVARRRVLRHEEWLYDIGPDRDRRLLQILDGRLQRIERLER